MDWFKTAIVSALGVIAFSILYHFVIVAPAPQNAKIDSELKDRAKKEELNNVSEGTPDRPTKESAPFRDEKAARELEQAQIEFERQVREDEAAARVRQDEENRQRSAAARSRALQVSLSQCLAGVDAAYHNRWNNTCSRMGQQANCSIPGPTSLQYDLVRRQERDECYTRFHTFQ